MNLIDPNTLLYSYDNGAYLLIQLTIALLSGTQGPIKIASSISRRLNE